MEARCSIQDPQERQEATKQIWNRLRLERKQRLSREMDKLLESSRGKGEPNRILKALFKRKQITSIMDSHEKLCQDKNEILEVFVAFYEKLYNAAADELHMPQSVGGSKAVTVEEIKEAMKKMRNGKACGDDGLYAELLKSGHEGLLALIASVFADILAGKAEVPETWCVSRMVVLFKKVEAMPPKNYSAISIVSSSMQALQCRSTREN